MSKQKISASNKAPAKAESNTVYLPGLNGIRAIAALAVVTLHIGFSLKNIDLNVAIFGRGQDGHPLKYFFGGYAVSVFFVLSGFLITYLMLLEKDKAEINIKKFYLRRLFRVWPLYYAFIFAMLMLIIVSKVPFEEHSLIYYLLLAPNLIAAGATPIPFINHFWSIGVEEQFYLFWPWIMKQRAVKILTPLLFIIVIFFAARLYLNTSFPDSALANFFMVNRFDCMLIGAVGAIIYKRDLTRIIKLIDNKATQLIMLCTGLLFALNIIHVSDIMGHLIVSILTIGIIIGQINVVNRIVNLDISIFRYLGKISFGIYVYHQFFIFLFTKLYKGILYDGFPKYFLMFFSVLTATIIVSHLSYKYFESWFIMRKNKYSVIHSSGILSKTPETVPEKTRITVPESVPAVEIYRNEEVYA